MTVYDEFVARKCKPGVDIDMSDPGDKHVMHMLLGLTGEVGELVDVLKKHLIYGQDLDIDHVSEELGDVHFYLTGIHNWLLGVGGPFRESILSSNMAKLSRRYPEGYTDEDAKIRADKS